MSEEGGTSRDQISAASITPSGADCGEAPSSSSSRPVDSAPTNLVAVKVYDDEDSGSQASVSLCAPAAKRRVFVGNLDLALSEADVLAAFKRFGPVAEVCLFKDADTQASTGYAFVVFVTGDGALAAMGELDGGSNMAAAGTQLWLDWAIGQGDMLCLSEQKHECDRRTRTLFFAKVQATATAEEVAQLFQKFGEVADLNLFRAWAGAKNSKGCGLVEMATREGAAAALADLNNAYKWPGMEEPMVLEWMKQSKQRSAGSGREPKAKEMCKVLLSNLPQGLNKAELLHTLGMLGEVVEVHITGEAAGQVADGSAFVRFGTKEEATSAVAALQAQPVHFRHPTLGTKHVLVASRALTTRSTPATAMQGDVTTSASSSVGGSNPRQVHRQHHSSSSASVRAVYPTYRVPYMGRLQPAAVPEYAPAVYPLSSVRPATPPQYAWPLQLPQQQAAAAAASMQAVMQQQQQQQQQRRGGADASRRHVPVWHTIGAPQQGGLQVPFMSPAGAPEMRWPPVDVCEALLAEEEVMGHLDVPVHVQHVLAQQVYASLPQAAAYPYYGPPLQAQGPQGGPQVMQIAMDSSHVRPAGGVHSGGYAPGMAPRQQQVGVLPMSSSTSRSYPLAQAWPQQQQQGAAAGYPVMHSAPVMYSVASNSSASGSFYQVPQYQQPPMPQGMEGRQYQVPPQAGGMGGPGLGYRAGVPRGQQVQVLAAPPAGPFAASSGHSTGTSISMSDRYLTTSMASIAGAAAGGTLAAPYMAGPSLRPPSAAGAAAAGGQPMTLQVQAGLDVVGGAVWNAAGGGAHAASGPQAGPDVATAFVPVTGEQAYAVAEQLVGMGASTGTSRMLVTAPDGSLQVAITGTPEQRGAAHVLLGIVVQENQGPNMGVGTL